MIRKRRTITPWPSENTCRNHQNRGMRIPPGTIPTHINQEQGTAGNTLRRTTLVTASRGTSKFILKFKIPNHVFLNLPNWQKYRHKENVLCLSFFNQKENLILLKLRNQQEKKDSLKEVLASTHHPQKRGAPGRGMKHVVVWCVGSSRHIHSESPW